MTHVSHLQMKTVPPVSHRSLLGLKILLPLHTVLLNLGLGFLLGLLQSTVLT